jgi:hypothetical protein
LASLSIPKREVDVWDMPFEALARQIAVAFSIVFWKDPVIMLFCLYVPYSLNHEEDNKSWDEEPVPVDWQATSIK